MAKSKTPKVEPLRSRTMTLGELQLKTLDLIQHLRFQLQRQAHQDGTTDEEFIEQFVEPLEEQIYADRYVLSQVHSYPISHGHRITN